MTHTRGAQLSSARTQTKEASTVNFEKTACPHHTDSFDLPRKSAHVPGNGARAELLFPAGGPVWRRLPASLPGRTHSNKDLGTRAVFAALGGRRTDNSTQWENTGNK